jgi:hypothetical protein
MNLPVKKILACVRADEPATDALAKLVAIGKRAKKSPLWDQLPTIDVDADVDEAVAWLQTQLKVKAVNGVYLGLDTLNEEAGSNIGIGTTSKCDADSSEIDWVYDLKKRGKPHLIRGLAQMHETWMDLEDEELQLVFDYTLFFGYSGVVLAEALARKQLQTHAVYVWGFHDGDMCPLARWSSVGFERLAAMPAGE